MAGTSAGIGNDAANVLARIGGGENGRQGGIDAMSQEARRLRANQTRAVTPSGLDGPGQYTSAYDLALIARAFFARVDFRRYVATRVADVPAQPGRAGLPDRQRQHSAGPRSRHAGRETGFTQLARKRTSAWWNATGGGSR